MQGRGKYDNAVVAAADDGSYLTQDPKHRTCLPLVPAEVPAESLTCAVTSLLLGSQKWESRHSGKHQRKCNPREMDRLDNSGPVRTLLDGARKALNPSALGEDGFWDSIKSLGSKIKGGDARVVCLHADAVVVQRLSVLGRRSKEV